MASESTYMRAFDIVRDKLAETQADLRVWIARAERVRALHVKREDYKGRPYCEECASLCHSRSGLGCDDVDGAWPCPTIAALDDTDDKP